MSTVTACVLGDIDLVRALAHGGIRPAVMAAPGSPSRYSRSTAALIDHADSSASPGLCVERLLDFAARQDEPPVLYFDGDWDLLMVSRFRERLADGLRFVVADAELVETLVDKEAFQRQAVQLGLPVPPARRLRAADDPGVRVPADFEVTLFAGDELAHDIYSMTIDSRGRVVVAVHLRPRFGILPHSAD